MYTAVDNIGIFWHIHIIETGVEKMKTVEHKGQIWNFEHFFSHRGKRYMRLSVGSGSKYFAINIEVA